ETKAVAPSGRSPGGALDQGPSIAVLGAQIGGEWFAVVVHDGGRGPCRKRPLYKPLAVASGFEVRRAPTECDRLWRIEGSESKVPPIPVHPNRRENRLCAGQDQLGGLGDELARH